MTSVMKTEKTKKVNNVKEYTSAEKNAVLEKLITARVALLLKHPFFGNLATRMRLIDASDWCSTLATDGRDFYYSVDFVNQLSTKETEFGFAHEILHNVFDHLGRRDHRNPTISNIAADFAVNQILKDEKIGEIPKNIKIFQDNKYRGWSYEQIYEDLESRSLKINISALGELLDEHIDPTDESEQGSRPVMSKEERQKIRDEIKEAMISAAQSVGAGNIPAGVARLIKDFTEPKMDWRQLLRMNIQSIVRNNFSFSRVNRKSQHSGAILPGLMNEETIDISIAVDMSGSISDKQAQDFLSEVKGIIDEYVDFKINIWCFDTQVYNHSTYTMNNADEFLSYQVKGGGGTCFDSNFRFMKDNEIQPKKFIMFTDGYPGGSWGDEDYCDTLFIIHGNNTIIPPYGQVAYYN